MSRFESTIERASSEDAAQLFPLVQRFSQSFVPDEASFKSAFKSLVSDTHAELWVAKEGRRVLGYILAFHHQTFFANGMVTWVEELMVEDSSRNKGIGTQLVRQVEESAKILGSKMIALATRRAAQFYQKNGYEDSAAYLRKKL